MIKVDAMRGKRAHTVKIAAECSQIAAIASATSGFACPSVLEVQVSEKRIGVKAVRSAKSGATSHEVFRFTLRERAHGDTLGCVVACP